MLEKKAARESTGFLMLPSSAVGGSLTWLKYVSEWLRGREPPRGGKTLEEIQLVIDQVNYEGGSSCT
jgi:hypothetical protein